MIALVRRSVGGPIGFWGGMMWQLYQATKEPVYKESAEELEKKLDAALMNYHVMDHDSGFRWLTDSSSQLPSVWVR